MQDTLCARLDPGFDFYKEYGSYARDAQRKARKRVVAGLRQRVRRGPTDDDWALLETVASTANEGLYRIRRLFTAPHDFLQLPYAIEKSVFTVMTTLSLGVRIALLTGVLMVGRLAIDVATGTPFGGAATLREVVSNPLYQLVVVGLSAVHLRLIFLRMADKTRTLLEGDSVRHAAPG